MSEFIVEDETINRIVTRLDRGRNGAGRNWAEGATYIMQRLGDHDVPTNPAELGQAMMDLNAQAIVNRYEDREPAREMLPEAERYAFSPKLDGRHTVLKSVECWLYQCTEGDIPETSDLFRIMQDYSHQLAHAIAASAPEYEQANWA